MGVGLHHLKVLLLEVLNQEDLQEVVFNCSVGFQQQLLGLLYVVFLILVVLVLALKSRGVRENYREAMYVALVMGFSLAIWVIWVVAGLIVPSAYQVRKYFNKVQKNILTIS